MRNLLTIFRRELAGYYTSAIGYIFIIVFLILSVGLFMTPFFTVLRMDMRSFFSTLPIIMCIFLPAVTMRLWAEERKQNTWETREINPQTPRVVAEIAACHAITDRPDEARSLLDELEQWTLREYVDPVNLAIVHLALGEDDQVFAWLERAFERRAIQMTRIGSDPRFERLYGDVRFRDLIERIGLREKAPRR